MKATAKAPANIAFIKYWGKKDDSLRLPANSSFSMNIDGAFTTSTVEFSDVLKTDEIYFDNGEFSDKEKNRIILHLDRIRALAGSKTRAKVVTRNSFPKGAGAASSASGFAALTVAGVRAAGLSLTQKDLTVLARIGSGSACRSIPDGFVLWEEGTDSESSYARSLYAPGYWSLSDILVIVEPGEKKISTTEGQESAATSPFYTKRIRRIPAKIETLKRIFQEKNFSELGELLEEECLDMHRVMQTQKPPIFYWTDTTKIIMGKVGEWRKVGIPVYFTIDAGPNIHLISETKYESQVIEAVKKLTSIISFIPNRVCNGTKLVNEHLF